MKLFHAALILSLASGAARAASADRVQNPLPTVGQVTTYSVKGGGDASVMLGGADAGLPVSLETNDAIRRKVTAVGADGTLTTDETVVRREFKVNDQPVQIAVPPRATVITDPTGKVQQVTVDGRSNGLPIGIGDLQSILALWQLPAKDFVPGQTWNQTVPLAAAEGADSRLSFVETYIGLKQVGGRSVMQFSSHLSAPVNIRPQGTHTLGGFTVTSLTLNSVDQRSSYDPVNGLLLDAKTSLKMDLNVTMGHDAGATPVLVKAPLELLTHLDKVETEAVSPAPGAPGAAPSPKAPDAGSTTETAAKTL